MKQYISNPVIVEACPAQELVAIVKNQQELPSHVQTLFVEGRIGFGDGVVYVEGVEARGNNWVVIDAENDELKVIEDEKFHELFTDGEDVPDVTAKMNEEPPRVGQTPDSEKDINAEPVVPNVSFPETVGEAPRVPSGPVPSAPRTNYQAPQGGTVAGEVVINQPGPSRHEPPVSPGQNLDALKN